MTRPVVLLDVMDTIVWDPYRLIPGFFGTDDWKVVFAQRDRTAWVEFEHGEIAEEAFLDRFFADGRDYDRDGLRALMFDNYRWLPGMQDLLIALKESGAEVHALSNYPSWYLAIEEKLSLSRYLSWSFVSCKTSFRKPDPEAFLVASRTLNRPCGELIFVDDRQKNVDGAIAAGLQGLLFEGAAGLEKDLTAAGAFG